MPTHIRLFGDRIAWAIVGLKLADDATAKFGPNFTKHITDAFTSVASSTEKFRPKFLATIVAIGNAVGLITGSIGKVEAEVRKCLLKLEDDAHAAGKNLMTQLAKGITEGAALVVSAAGAIRLNVGTPATSGAGAAARHAEAESLKELSGAGPHGCDRGPGAAQHGQRPGDGDGTGHIGRPGVPVPPHGQ